jgi:GMP synthase PP-ATPase subunit
VDDTTLLAKVNEVVKPFGCETTELGPDSVGVQGDYRVHCPSVYVRFPKGITMAEAAVISNKVTNEVPGISRVMMEIQLT